MMIGAGKGSPLYLLDGKSITVWKFPCTTAGASSSSISLLCVTVGELLWPFLSACASCTVSSFVAGGDTHTDFSPARELCPARENHR